ncbi:MAG TPA: TerC family protein [Dongiaceae bacterium]
MIPELVALAQVIVIDLVLAGDNAIVVGMAAAGLPANRRVKVIFIGIAAATVMRILFALVANQLLVIIGLTLAGGILLLWVCWKFWRELNQQRRAHSEAAKSSDPHGESYAGSVDNLVAAGPTKTVRQAVVQIVLADLSMSLDNVLAVAGAAAEHTWVLVIGLVLSVGLMGAAATLIAGLLKRYYWIAYIGLAIILWVSVDMIYRGSNEVMDKISEANAPGISAPGNNTPVAQPAVNAP